MTTVAHVTDRMQALMTTIARELGRRSGFIQRERTLDGSLFARMLVFGWMGNPEASLSELSRLLGAEEIAITRQGVASRFTVEAVEFMWGLLQAVLGEVMAGPRVELAVLQRFEGVYVLDSTGLSLPTSLAQLWPGCGGSAGPSAGLKVSVLWDLVKGGLEQIEVMSGRTHDQRAQAASQLLPVGALRLTDLGYFKLTTFQALDQAGVYWLSAYKQGTTLTVHGEQLVLSDYLATVGEEPTSCWVEVGVRTRIPARLVAVRVSPETLTQRQHNLAEWERKKQCRASALTRACLAWDLYLTNIPPDLLTAPEVLAVAHVRWQIELLFKLWKSEGQLDQWRTRNPWRILCEIYAKLIALLFQHWLFLVSTWALPDRSPTQACRTVRNFAWWLASGMSDLALLRACVCHILAALQGCRMGKSKTAPRTFQRLAALT